ncbi:MAG: cytochrome c553 [Janthinobacterium sp.]|jgi:cytochrome c553
MRFSNAIMLIRQTVLLTAAGLGFCAGAHAAGDAVAGQAKAQACFACHGVNGIATASGIPHLAAQPSLSIFYQLVQFREQNRKGGGMEVFALNLSDRDMRDIGAYFAALPAPPATDGDAARIALGQRISQQNYCQSCHGATLQGQKHVPRLAGQASDYFVTQLRNLRSATRIDMDGNMASAAKNLTDDDIDALVVFARSMP